MEIEVESWGRGPRVVLVHGVISNGPETWKGQRDLSEDWNLVVPTRRGYVPNPPSLGEDYDGDAKDVVSYLVPHRRFRRAASGLGGDADAWTASDPLARARGRAVTFSGPTSVQSGHPNDVGTKFGHQRNMHMPPSSIRVAPVR
jgi:hypothetical protein